MTKKEFENVDAWLSYIEEDRNLLLIRFIFTWASIESYLNLKYSSLGNSITDKIIKFSSQAEANIIYMKSVSCLIKTFRATNLNGDRTYIVDLRYPSQPNKYVYFDEKHCSLKDFLLVIFALRSNLIHGRKLLQSEETTKLLTWCSKYLNPFWESYIQVVRESLNSRRD